MKKIGFVIILLLGCLLIGCKNKHPKIGLLVHAYDVERWQNDQKYFEKAVKQLGGKPLIRMAENSAVMQFEQAKELIKEKVTVLVVIPVDQNIAAKIVELAHENEIPVIAYDRLINNCRLDYYVSTDNLRVGEIQASYLLKVRPIGTYALLGGPPNDNNSRMLYLGQMNILEPLVETGKVRIGYRQFANNWSSDEGYRLAKAALDSTKNKLDAIICGNDAIALGAIKALKERSLEGHVAVAGQDADKPNIEQIMKGNQTMTVLKKIRTMASVAAELAVHLGKGESVDIHNSTISNGLRLVPSYLVDAQVVTEGNISMTIIPDAD